jgi:G3E family GTPase
MTPHRTAVNVIFGASDSGKTRLIESLLERRPNTERWAVLMNDFGGTAQRSPPTRLLRNVAVRETGGCACCTGQLVLRTALVSLLRAQRPARVLIEASAAADPNALLALLRDPELASAVHVQTIFATAGAHQLLDVRYLSAPVYRAQVEAADVVVLGGPEALNEAERAAARATLSPIISRSTRVIENPREVDLSMLDFRSQPSP